jgi:hypothetical protein
MCLTSFFSSLWKVHGRHQTLHDIASSSKETNPLDSELDFHCNNLKDCVQLERSTSHQLARHRAEFWRFVTNARTVGRSRRSVRLETAHWPLCSAPLCGVERTHLSKERKQSCVYKTIELQICSESWINCLSYGQACNNNNHITRDMLMDINNRNPSKHLLINFHASNCNVFHTAVS